MTINLVIEVISPAPLSIFFKSFSWPNWKERYLSLILKAFKKSLQIMKVYHKF